MSQAFGFENIPGITRTSANVLSLAATNVGKPTRFSIGGQAYALSAAVTVDITLSGAGGRDTGAIANSTVYYVYAILNQSSSAVALISSATSPSTGPTMPSGYGTAYRLIGTWISNTSAQIDVVQGYLGEIPGVLDSVAAKGFFPSFPNASPNYIVGVGEESASPLGGVIRAPNVAAGNSNVQGANFIIQTGIGTGTGGSGIFGVQVALPDGSGSAVNTRHNAFIVGNTSACTFGFSLFGADLTHTLQSAGNTTIAINSPSAKTPIIRMNINAIEKFACGAAGAISDGINGTAVGDSFIRAASNLFFSGNGGGASHGSLSNTGAWIFGPSGGGVAHLFRGSLTVGNNTTGDANLGTISSVSNSAYYEGSFTVTANGISGSPTGTAYYVKSGKMVSLLLPSLSGTFSGTSFTYTGIPSALQPVRDQEINEVYAINNSAVIDNAKARITGGTGTVTFFTGGYNAWTASGTRAIGGGNFNFTYILI